MYFCPACFARRAQSRAAFGLGLKCFASISYCGMGMPSTSIAHSWRPMTLYSPQWMNMPNLASCHHLMRRSCSGGGPDCAAGLLALASCGRPKGADTASPAEAASSFKYSRRDVLIMLPSHREIDAQSESPAQTKNSTISVKVKHFFHAGPPLAFSTSFKRTLHGPH